MNGKEVSKSYEGPQDLPMIMEELLRDAKVIDISIGVHRPDLRGCEAVQNLVRIAYTQGIQIGERHVKCPMRCCEGLPKNI